MHAELALRDAWVAEHFKRFPAPVGDAPDQTSAGVKTTQNYGPVQRNGRDGRRLQIAGRTFEKGFYCHAPSRLIVRLSKTAKTISAVVGGETNGNYTGGSVVFTVSWHGKELYRSPMMLRGKPGIPINVDVNGMSDFEIAVEDAGDGNNSDQACWGDAKVTYRDGEQDWLSDLPSLDERSRRRLPYTFFYGADSSDDLLADWGYKESSKKLPAGKTEITRLYWDPVNRFEVRLVAVVYNDFPTVEWTLYFKNAGFCDTPIISNIEPLDVAFAARSPLLHHFTGAVAGPNDYQPFETPLKSGEPLTLATAGGRPTNTNLPYFNLETGDGGVLAVLSWAGQWSAEFTRTNDQVRVQAGQELTHFVLHPGEEVRSPMAVLQFYKGDWIDAQNVWRRWMFAHNLPRPWGKALKPMSAVCMGNSYPGIITNAVQEQVYLKRYVEEGMKPDFWWQDAGWYKCGDPPSWGNTGTWEVEPKRWPKGIREVSDWCRAQGFRTLVWFEPERVAAGTWLAENRPNWILGGKNGGLLNLGLPECRTWITDHIEGVLTEQGIDAYRQDFNIDPLSYWRANDAIDRQGITEIRHVEGISHSGTSCSSGIRGC